MLTTRQLRELGEQMEAEAEAIGRKLPAQYRNLSAFIVAKVCARTYTALGEALEMITAGQQPPTGKALEAVKRFSERNQAIRRAAANGDWDELTRLVDAAGSGQPAGPGESGSAAGA